ncbi:hypothetical protein EOM89_06810, partial [Candidatus Falkowbacteria bacterium]|nr:hypothetical protein [Candidatus Falkowbacteria bacterium]
ERVIQTGIGPVPVRRQKVRDRAAVSDKEKIRFTVCAVSDPLISSVPAGRVNGDFPSEVSKGGRDGGWRRRFWWPDRCDFADTGLPALAG